MPVAVILRSDLGAGPAIGARLESQDYAVHGIVDSDVERTTVSDLVARTCSDGVDLLVNNIPQFEVSRIVNGTERFRSALDRGLHSTFSACREAARVALDRGSELVVINIASVTAVAGLAGHAAEACVSAGLIAATKALAAEWGGAGVRVNVVMVGPTPAWLSDTGHLADVPGVVPLGRTVSHDDVAAAVAALASSDMAAVTGQVLTVDAGWLAHGWRRE